MMERLFNLLGYGRASVIDDGHAVQRVQVTERAIGGPADAVSDDVPRLTEYGFTSFPPIGADVLVLYRGGARGAPVVVATAHQPSRPKGMAEGDVAIYDRRGRVVRLTDKGVEIEAGGGEVHVSKARRVRCECDVETTGDVVSRAGGVRVSLNGLYDAYQRHNHPPVSAGTSWGSGPPIPRA